MVFVIITSERGDVLELLDSNGDAFAAYRYDEWGNPIGAGNYATGIWTQASSVVNSTLAGQIASRQILRYASYAYDAESGLYYLSTRSYDPLTRQFISKDPAKADGEESAYQYCGGEPVGKEDASGAYAERIFFPVYNGRHYSACDWTSYYRNVLETNAKVAWDHRLAWYMPNFMVAHRMAWFINMVRGGGRWDLKLAASKSYRTEYYIRFRGPWNSRVSPEKFGDLHLGYVGHAMGFPLHVIHTGSFIYACGQRIIKGYFGDEADDRRWISYGYNLYNRWGWQWPGRGMPHIYVR